MLTPFRVSPLRDGKKVATVNGAEATIKVGKDGVMVDDAKVVTGLFNSGIPLDSMDKAFAGTSVSRIK